MSQIAPNEKGDAQQNVVTQATVANNTIEATEIHDAYRKQATENAIIVVAVFRFNKTAVTNMCTVMRAIWVESIIKNTFIIWALCVAWRVAM